MEKVLRGSADLKKMLYIMSVDWEWTFQRPQIMAEMLSDDYAITAMFPRSITSRKFKVPKHEKINFKILWTLPFQEKNKFIYFISLLINRNKIKHITDEYDYIYVGYPLYGRYIPDSYKGKVIYDCMDNYEVLYPDQKRKSIIVDQEVKLVQRCDYLIASSEYLRKKMNGIVGFPKSALVRNGTKIDFYSPVKEAEKKSGYSIGYVGTLSHWLDIKLLRDSLTWGYGITYHFIGKNETESIEGGVYHGIINHDLLPEKVNEFDCLIMPFVVNDIVLAVDPVKMYEYIAFGKCIVSVYYPELEQFSDYVYFYNSSDEYKELLEFLTKEGFPPKYNNVQQKKMLENSTWNARYKALKEILST